MKATTLIRTSAAAALVVAATLFTIGAAPAATTRTGTHAASPYGWPVKPFDRRHPVRGSFGDPRTIFNGPPTARTLLAGSGNFQFHDGVDISAPDGTAVYPVESGVVSAVVPHWPGITVTTPEGRTFEYIHITPNVAVGAQVVARATVLGHILHGCGHVHLTELQGGVPVNPLAAGRLTPYRDTTKPTIRAITFRGSATGGGLMPEILRGRIEPVADIYDTATLPVPGIWHDMPVAPALVEWSIRQAATGKVVVPTRVAFDVRDRLPATSAFWTVYARGSHQNMSVFGKHYSYMQPGVYDYRLAPGGFDTHALPDGVYELSVKASDIRGNSTTAMQRFSVHNRPGVVGP
jgi:hypothetical protein